MQYSRMFMLVHVRTAEEGTGMCACACMYAYVYVYVYVYVCVYVYVSVCAKSLLRTSGLMSLWTITGNIPSNNLMNDGSNEIRTRWDPWGAT